MKNHSKLIGTVAGAVVAWALAKYVGFDVNALGIGQEWSALVQIGVGAAIGTYWSPANKEV